MSTTSEDEPRDFHDQDLTHEQPGKPLEQWDREKRARRTAELVWENTAPKLRQQLIATVEAARPFLEEIGRRLRAFAKEAAEMLSKIQDQIPRKPNHNGPHARCRPPRVLYDRVTSTSSRPQRPMRPRTNPQMAPRHRGKARGTP